VLAPPTEGQIDFAEARGFEEGPNGEIMFRNPNAGQGAGPAMGGGGGMRIDASLSPEMQAQVAAMLASAQPGGGGGGGGFFGMGGGAPPEADGLLGGETLLFNTVFKKPLEAEWTWLRPNEAHQEISSRGPLRIRAQAGGIWESAFARNPAGNFLFRALPAGCGGVEARVKLMASSYGEQAGIFWYQDDNNYVKLVIEGMKDGTAALVLAAESGGQAAVCGKIPLGKNEESQTLRLEMGANGKLSGMLDNGACMRKVGEAVPPAGAGLKVGVGAHGGGTEARWASFEWFRALSIPEDRANF
jgi:regulation of enolase protein 1 (concanavalin A-like superfamily)